MSLGTSANVLVGIPDVSGGLWVADLIEKPADLPNETADLSEKGFVSVGFVSEDGVTETSERDTDKIKAWGGDTVRVIQNEHSLTYTFTLIEMGNEDVLRLVFGDDNVLKKDDGSVGIKKNAKILPHKTWAVEVLDGEEKIRLVIPDGQITETGDRTFVHSDLISIELTVEAFTDRDGNKGYEYHSKLTDAQASGKPTNPVDTEYKKADSATPPAGTGGNQGGGTGEA